MPNDADPSSVIKVGDGRGFIVEYRVRRPAVRLQSRTIPPIYIEHRVVITAAHCLPPLTATPAASYHEKTFPGLLGNIDGSKKAIAAECLFADPVADIAILGSPDCQEFYSESNYYDDLVNEVPVLLIGNARNGRGWLLALTDNRWVETTLNVFVGSRGMSLGIGPTESGMSGSPILNHNGKAVGVVCVGSETGNDGVRKTERAWGQPILSRSLPGWMLAP